MEDIRRRRYVPSYWGVFGRVRKLTVFRDFCSCSLRGGRRNVRSKYVPMTNIATNNDENEEDAIRAMNVTKRILQNQFSCKKIKRMRVTRTKRRRKNNLGVRLSRSRPTNDQTKIETSGEVSFCPQFDFLWPQLTVREHLQLRLVFSDRGVRKQKEMTMTMAATTSIRPRNQLSSRRSRLNSPSRTNSTSKSQHFLAARKSRFCCF